jgi:hypothetical protein
MTILGRCSDTPMREQFGLPVVFLLLAGAVVLGCDMIARPKRHFRGYIGGEMHRELKEIEIQLLGALIIAGGCWAMYQIIMEVWITCFR